MPRLRQFAVLWLCVSLCSCANAAAPQPVQAKRIATVATVEAKAGDKLVVLRSYRDLKVVTTDASGTIVLVPFTDFFTVIDVPGTGPDPNPIPPGPQPPPVPPGDVSPIPDRGLRVLIVYADGSLSAAQRELLASPTLRGWLDTNCAKNKYGSPEWRFVRDVVEFAGDQPIWQKLMSVPRAKSVWLIACDGKRGSSIAVPDNMTPSELIAILQKFDLTQ